MLLDEFGKGIRQCDKGPGNRGGPRSPVRLNHIAVNPNRAFAHGTHIRHSPEGPPYQPLVYFTGSGAFTQPGASRNIQLGSLDYLVKSGRLLVQPIFNGSFERMKEPLNLADTITLNRLVVDWRGDLGRTIDYLVSRPDVDAGGWNSDFPVEPKSGQGAVDITIAGPGRFTLSDNWFTCRTDCRKRQ